MGRRENRGGLRALRRGAALALALVTLWVISLTAQPPEFSTFFAGLGENPDLAVSLLSFQLGTSLQGQDELGWQERLLLAQSALLPKSLTDDPSDQTETPEETGELSLHQEEDQGDETATEPLVQGEVEAHTASGSDDGSYLSLDKVYIKNSTDQAVDVEALAAQTLELDLGDGPQILIYHTHGSEAYTQTEEERYVESDAYRTTDCTRNVVQVGEAMAEEFRALGLEVIHDTTLYDYPEYNGAYQRSRAGVEKWLEQYPTIRFVLDVHRDAIVSADGAAYQLIAQEGEVQAAQVMLVVGSSDGGAEHPNWRTNLALAVKLQLALTEDYDQLARPIALRASRYNQDLSTGALLVEVGGHGNTLSQALTGARMFAQTVGRALKEL